MPEADARIGVLCVDDNPEVAIALRLKLIGSSRFDWKGWLPAADALVDTVRRERPSVVLIDLDMPGPNAFDAIAAVLRACPDTRVVVYSGHVRPEFVIRALEVGAWGYASKNDGEVTLLDVLRSVAAGEVVFSPEVRTVLARR